MSILRQEGDHWVVETSSGADPPTRPEQADLVDELAPGVVLALRGRELTADDRRVLVAFGAQLAGALERSQLTREAASASALAKANELRTALLQAVSHDLRTPLAAIKASVSSLRQPDVEWSEEEHDEFLEAIEDQTDRLTGLVANLLDMSRLQAGVIQPQLRAVGYEEVVHTAVRGLGEGAARVDVDVPESLPPVLADAALLERIVANLVDNAVTASPEATPRPGAGARSRRGGRAADRRPGPGHPARGACPRARAVPPHGRRALGDRRGPRPRGGPGLRRTRCRASSSSTTRPAVGSPRS